jgi:NAD-dependent deacetylase
MKAWSQGDEERLRAVIATRPRVVVMTGAGVSAESGVPTFRGAGGYWTVGSDVFQAQDISTTSMWQSDPSSVWSWYLYRRGVCHQVKPNAAHHALAALERLVGDRFTLITQNVDGLHARAGNSDARTCLIHGDLSVMRCAAACCPELQPIPLPAHERARGTTLSEAERSVLVCARCGGQARPHVLFWDESYDDDLYRSARARDAASQADLMVVVGTSGATQLPALLHNDAAANGALLVNIDIEPNVFSKRALRLGGCFIEQPAATALPMLVGLCASYQ